MPKVLKPLTNAELVRAVATTSTAGSRLDLRDGAVPGLRLRTGARRHTWSLTSMVGGRRVQLPIGYYPAMSLAEAREAASRKREDMQVFGAPVVNPVVSAPATLRELLGYYEAANGKDLRTWPEILKMIRLVFGKYLDTPLIKLDARMLQQTADFYPAKSSAAKAVKVLRPVLRFARRRGFVFLDPNHLETPPHNTAPRQRVMSTDEVIAVWRALGYTAHDDCVRLLFLTACRRSEVAEARWEEINFKTRVWAIPSHRTKEKRTHAVYLSDEALNIFSRLRALHGGETVFATPPTDNWDYYQKKLNKRSGTSGWHRHDIRRTAATMLAKLGYAPHIIEMVLGHRDAHTPLASVYQTYRYDAEVEAAMMSLGNYLMKLVE